MYIRQIFSYYLLRDSGIRIHVYLQLINTKHYNILHLNLQHQQLFIKVCDAEIIAVHKSGFMKFLVEMLIAAAAYKINQRIITS